MKKMKKMLALSLALVLALSLAACARSNDHAAASGSAGMNPKDDPTAFLSSMQNWWPDDALLSLTAAVTTPTQDPQAAPAQGLETASGITLEEAKAIAYAAAGIAEEQAADRDYELDKGVYEIDFCYGGVEYDYYIQAAGGKLLHASQHPCDDHCQTHPGNEHHSHHQVSGNLIGLDQALAIAAQHAGVAQADITDRDCDLENGVYELEFTAGGIEYEYDIEAVTGRIIWSEQEPDDDWNDRDDCCDDDWDDCYDDDCD